MAFPSVLTVIDDYNRSDREPITGGPGYTNPFGFPSAGFTGHRIVGNRLAASTLTGSSGSATTTSYGPDVEVYIEFAAITGVFAAGDGIYLWARVQNAGTDNFSAYGVWYHRFSTGEYELALLRDDLGSDTGLDTIGGTSTPIFADGDAMGIQCIGNQIGGYYRVGGVWTLMSGITRTDNTYSTAGPVATFSENFELSWRLDNLTGGTVGAAPSSRPPQGMIQTLNWVGCGVRRAWHRRSSGIFVPKLWTPPEFAI